MIKELLAKEKQPYVFVVRSLIVGLVTGFFITIYSNLIVYATNVNKTYPLLIVFIPLGTVITYLLFSAHNPKARHITDDAIKSINNDDVPLDQLPETINPVVGLITLVGTFFTHLFGASGGKEGAGVQIGFATAALVKKTENKLLKRTAKDSDFYLMCGAASAFGALFNAPFAGLMFGTQFASPKKTRLDSYLPCTIASYTSVLTSRALGIHNLILPEVMPISFTVNNTLIIFVFALIAGYFSRFFTYGIHYSKNLFKKWFPKTLVRNIVAATILTASSFIFYAINKDFRYNGLGTEMLIANINGNSKYWDFLIKFVFVALTSAAAFLGGEVVPILIFGSGAGMVFASIFSLDVSAFAVLGAVALFSGSTNLPLVALALGLEFFGYSDVITLFLA
ncbi:MAG: chloride channel protein, partial [Sphaerochaetaceae bacterium]|nr:chloride channel protein [Sphaerochaetaceae bacterium]